MQFKKLFYSPKKQNIYTVYCILEYDSSGRSLWWDAPTQTIWHYNKISAAGDYFIHGSEFIKAYPFQGNTCFIHIIHSWFLLLANSLFKVRLGKLFNTFVKVVGCPTGWIAQSFRFNVRWPTVHAPTAYHIHGCWSVTLLIQVLKYKRQVL